MTTSPIRLLVSRNFLLRGHLVKSVTTVTSPVSQQVLEKGFRRFHTGLVVFAHPAAIYEEILELPNQPYKLLIDVRRQVDFEQCGSIPGALNVPFCDIPEAFGDEMNPDKFKQKYGFPKPKKDQYIIFSCNCGLMSRRAMEILEELGYEKVRYYLGSYEDWQKRKVQDNCEPPNDEDGSSPVDISDKPKRGAN